MATGHAAAKAKILIVDDDPKVVQLLRANLTIEGYEVNTAQDGAEGLELLESELPDLAILDLVMPKMDGYELTRRIREFSSVPIIILTARSSELEIVQGFDVGADDYLTKPFSVNELLVRVRAVLRRSKFPSEIVNRPPVRIGDLLIDFGLRSVEVRGNPVALTPIEYRLLEYLASNLGRVVLHQDLLQHVWGPEYRDEIEYVRVYIRYLRQKIEENPSEPKYIITKPGAGYMLQEPET